MKRLALAVMLVAMAAAPATAQMSANALGKGMPNPQLPDGTITVRVFNGSPTEALDGLVVTLADDKGTARSARTDAKGRALFAGLVPLTNWKAKVTHEEQTAESDLLEVPDKGGLEVVLSPAPWQAPKASSDGRPPPSKMSSRVRPERALNAGSLQVKLLGGTWEKLITDHPVHLVGLVADGGVIHKAAKTDAGGRALFENLRGRDVTYYVLSVVPGSNGDERLMSEPIQMLPGVGMALALVGSAPGASEAEDDLNELYRNQEPKPVAGVVEIRMGGSRAALDSTTEVELIEVSNPDVVAKGAVRAVDTMVLGEFVVNGQVNDKQEVGTARVGVIRQSQPVKGVSVELLQTGATEPVTVETDDRGLAEFPGLEVGAEYTPTVVMFNKRISGEPFKIPAKGGVLSAAAVAWESNTKQATFTALPWGPDKIYVARARQGARVHSTPPFQITNQVGATVPLHLSPTPALRFHLGGVINDEYLSLQGVFMMENGPFMPYSDGSEDMLIPLPRGFLGAHIEERMANRVKIVDHKGLLWKGAVPAGGFRFEVSFALPIDGGVTDINWDLPHGAAGSNLRFQYVEGMEFKVLGNAEGKLTRMRNGTPIYEMGNINIPAKRSMVMQVTGLPHHPAWNTWVKLAIGLVVAGALLFAVVVIFRSSTGRAQQAAGRRERRERLLDELAELERKHRDGEVTAAKYAKSKKRLVEQLEPLYEARKAS